MFKAKFKSGTDRHSKLFNHVIPFANYAKTSGKGKSAEFH